MKKLMVCIVILSLISSVFLGFPGSASADVNVMKCRIDRIGMYFPNETRGAMVYLTDMSSTPQWAGSRQFFLSQTYCGKEGLAILLTAFSNEKTVWVRVVGTTPTANSLINAVWVNN